MDVFRFETLSAMGSRKSHDTIADFGKGDRIDLSGLDADLTRPGRQEAKFLGSLEWWQALKPGKVGTFYFDKATQELVFEANGDGIGDYAISLPGVAALDSWHLIV